MIFDVCAFCVSFVSVGLFENGEISKRVYAKVGIEDYGILGLEWRVLKSE